MLLSFLAKGEHREGCQGVVSWTKMEPTGHISRTWLSPSQGPWPTVVGTGLAKRHGHDRCEVGNQKSSRVRRLGSGRGTWP